jgi:nitroreductase
VEFFHVIRNRRSVRIFTNQSVEQDVLSPVLKAIQSAPTAGNLQAYQVYVVESPDKIKALAQAAYNQPQVIKAPVVLVFCTDAPRSAVKYADRGRELYCIVDTSIAITMGHLAAVAQGLGSVIVGAFEPEKVARIVGAPKHQVPILMLPMGYPKEEPEATPRRNLDDLFVRV